MKKGKVLLLGAISLASLGFLTACPSEADIGILEYGAFDALENARHGFEDELKEKGYGHLTIEYKNAQASAQTNSTYATGMAGKHKLNLAIATPSATAIKAAQDNIGDTTPLLFTAVTDPVDAGLVKSINNGEGYASGTSDLQPDEALNAQINLVKTMLPSATKLGVFYCASETNSAIQAEKVKSIAAGLGLDVIESKCTDQMDINTKVLNLANQVDAIWIPTDNTIANSVNKVKEAIGDKKVLVIMGEEGMVAGGHVSVSVNYYKLGQITADMAIQIIEGKKASDIPVYIPTIESCEYVYSSVNMAQAGFDTSILPSTAQWKDIDAK